MAAVAIPAVVGNSPGLSARCLATGAVGAHFVQPAHLALNQKAQKRGAGAEERTRTAPRRLRHSTSEVRWRNRPTALLRRHMTAIRIFEALECTTPRRPASTGARDDPLCHTASRCNSEVLRVMLADGHRFIGVSEVVALAAFGKDAVAEALDNLHRGGLLDGARARNQRVFRLARRADFLALVGSEPDWQRSWNWPLVLPVMVGCLDAAELPEMMQLARAAELRQRLREWEPTLARLRVVTTSLRNGTEFLDDYEALTLRALRLWSGAGAWVRPK